MKRSCAGRVGSECGNVQQPCALLGQLSRQLGRAPGASSAACNPRAASPAAPACRALSPGADSHEPCAVPPKAAGPARCGRPGCPGRLHQRSGAVGAAAGQRGGAAHRWGLHRRRQPPPPPPPRRPVPALRCPPRPALITNPLQSPASSSAPALRPRCGRSRSWTGRGWSFCCAASCRCGSRWGLPLRWRRLAAVEGAWRAASSGAAACCLTAERWGKRAGRDAPGTSPLPPPTTSPLACSLATGSARSTCSRLWCWPGPPSTAWSAGGCCLRAGGCRLLLGGREGREGSLARVHLACVTAHTAAATQAANSAAPPPRPAPRCRSIIKREVEDRLGSHGEFGRVSFARLSFGK